MRAFPRSALTLASLLLGGGVLAAPLTPNTGALTMNGELADSGSQVGSFSMQAVLKDGNFTGTATLTVDGTTLSGALLDRRSYLENGRCYFRFENGRARAEISGRCDDAGLEGGRFETFIPGLGLKTGTAKARFAMADGAPATAQLVTGKLPSGKLVCAFNEPKVSFKWGEATQYTLQYSNMVNLTLAPGGAYTAGSARGRYSRQDNKIRLVSGPFEGAIGTLENDRSGTPAVVFHIEENRRADGVHVVDPYTTRCTKAR